MARQLGRMKKATVLPAPRVERPLAGESRWSNERRAFLRLRPSLLRSHRGSYVAIHQSKVVDSGKDKVALGLRVYARFGYVPIYVGRVLARPIRAVRIPSPRRPRRGPAE
jgi:hypothetical protein